MLRPVIKRKVFDLSEDRCQSNTRAEPGCDEQPAYPSPTQPGSLSHGRIKRHATKRMPGVGGKSLFAQPASNLVGSLPQLVIGLMHHHGCVWI